MNVLKMVGCSNNCTRRDATAKDVRLNEYGRSDGAFNLKEGFTATHQFIKSAVEQLIKH